MLRWGPVVMNNKKIIVLKAHRTAMFIPTKRIESALMNMNSSALTELTIPN
ncbi:hypothetical protein GCM10011404_34380 [Sphingomonas prati]|nr:hypothetical protein GCM10011404_34380 [Sphingomonas prati]